MITRVNQQTMEVNRVKLTRGVLTYKQALINKRVHKPSRATLFEKLEEIAECYKPAILRLSFIFLLF